MADSIDILIGVGMGLVMFFILLCGLHNCFLKDSSSVVSSISPHPLLMYSANVKDSENADR